MGISKIFGNQNKYFKQSADGTAHVQLTGGNLKSIGYVFSAAAADETIIPKPNDGKIGVIHIVAEVASGITSPTVTLKDGTTEIGTWAVPAGDAITIVTNANPLDIDGDLVAQVSDTGITISAWAVKV